MYRNLLDDFKKNCDVPIYYYIIGCGDSACYYCGELLACLARLVHNSEVDNRTLKLR